MELKLGCLNLIVVGAAVCAASALFIGELDARNSNIISTVVFGLKKSATPR